MAAPVTYLCPYERIRLDPTRIGFLYAELGGAEMQVMLDRAMAELGHVHDAMSQHYAMAELPEMEHSLRRIRRISDHLGLSGVARVAMDVGICLERGDSTAIAATWARLTRSVDQARHGNLSRT